MVRTYTESDRALEEVILAVQFLPPYEAKKVLQEALDMITDGEKKYRSALGI